MQDIPTVLLVGGGDSAGVLSCIATDFETLTGEEIGSFDGQLVGVWGVREELEAASAAARTLLANSGGAERLPDLHE